MKLFIDIKDIKNVIEYCLIKFIFCYSSNLDSSRAMSMSAPSAINTDMSTVRFEDEPAEWNYTGPIQAKSTMSHRFTLVYLKFAIFYFYELS